MQELKSDQTQFAHFKIRKVKKVREKKLKNCLLKSFLALLTSTVIDRLFVKINPKYLISVTVFTSRSLINNLREEYFSFCLLKVKERHFEFNTKANESNSRVVHGL